MISSLFAAIAAGLGLGASLPNVSAPMLLPKKVKRSKKVTRVPAIKGKRHHSQKVRSNRRKSKK